jgi:hypothetical protein
VPTSSERQRIAPLPDANIEHSPTRRYQVLETLEQVGSLLAEVVGGFAIGSLVVRHLIPWRPVGDWLGDDAPSRTSAPFTVPIAFKTQPG